MRCSWFSAGRDCRADHADRLARRASLNEAGDFWGGFSRKGEWAWRARSWPHGSVHDINSSGGLLKILLTERGDALNTVHIVNLFRSPTDTPSPVVPPECPFRQVVGESRHGVALIAELATGRFVLVESLPTDELAEQTFWLLIAEMQYDNEPRMIRLSELRARAFTPGAPGTVNDILEHSALDFSALDFT